MILTTVFKLYRTCHLRYCLSLFGRNLIRSALNKMKTQKCIRFLFHQSDLLYHFNFWLLIVKGYKRSICVEVYVIPLVTNILLISIL